MIRGLKVVNRCSRLSMTGVSTNWALSTLFDFVFVYIPWELLKKINYLQWKMKLFKWKCLIVNPNLKWKTLHVKYSMQNHRFYFNHQSRVTFIMILIFSVTIFFFNCFFMKPNHKWNIDKWFHPTITVIPAY